MILILLVSYYFPNLRLVAIEDRTAAATTINTIADKTITDLRAEGIW